jgi:phytoene dehydrogenase-like protein
VTETFDYVVIGSGTGGLSVAALLANSGASVALLEAHEHPGGCAHTFPMGDYRFCASVHYIFWCGEGEPVYNVLSRLGLRETVRFNRLDPEGYDHFSCPSAGVRFRIPSGLDKLEERLVFHYPDDHAGLRKYFKLLRRLLRDLKDAPFELRPRDLLVTAVQRPRLTRMLNWTLQDLFDRAGLSAEVQAVIATQVGDLGLAPERLSLLMFAALTNAYGNGAWHPELGFEHMVESMTDVVRDAPGCRVELSCEVVGIDIEDGRATGVRAADGRRFGARVVIGDIDPRRVVDMAGKEHFPRRYLKKLDWEDSTSAFSLYLGLEGIDLREHGFGPWNIWHYPGLDINQIYRTQNDEGDLSDPWLFLSSPTLLSGAPRPVDPSEDRQVLLAVTTAAFAPWAMLKADDKRGYSKAKRVVRERILDIIEQHYVPGIRDHVAVRVAGSPTTLGRYVATRHGNIYGPELTPANAALGRVRYATPIDNVYLTGAAAEYPSVGATIAGGARLYAVLTGDHVDRSRGVAELI